MGLQHDNVNTAIRKLFFEWCRAAKSTLPQDPFQ